MLNENNLALQNLPKIIRESFGPFGQQLHKMFGESSGARLAGGTTQALLGFTERPHSGEQIMRLNEQSRR